MTRSNNVPTTLVAIAMLATLGLASSARGQSVSTADPTTTPPSTQSDSERAKQRRKASDEGDTRDSSTPRPYRAVFGGASTRTDLTQVLDLRATVSEAYDQNRLADATSPDSSRLTNSNGFYTALVGDLAYARKGTRFGLAATGGANARYYRDLQQLLGTDYHVGAGLSGRLSPRTSVRVNQAFSYAPVDLLGVFVTALQPGLGAVATPSTDFAVNDNRSYANATSGDLSRRLSARAEVSFSASTRLTHFLANRSANNRFRELGGGGTYKYRMNQNVSLRLGYGYRGAQYTGATGGASSPAEHSFDVGLDMRHTISDTRRTYFTLRTGSALLQAPAPSLTQASTRQLRVLVDSSLTQQLGETWQLVGSYRRGSDLVQGLASPVFTDAVAFTASGFLSRHVDFKSSAAYSSGEPSLATTSQNFTSYTGDARLRIALGPKWAATAEYLYYFYDFSKAPQLALGYVPRFSRNSAKVGLSLWLPLGLR